LRALEERTAEPARVRALVCAALLVAWFTWMPWRAFDKYTNYRGMNAAVRRLLASKDLGRSLVLVYGERFPSFESAAIYNPLDLESGVPIFAWASDLRVRGAILDHYADRQVWLLTAQAGGSFHLQGPLPANRVSRNDLTDLTEGVSNSTEVR
jgi:hypothetical protein